MKSDRKSASSYGILSEEEAKKLLCYYALGRADRSFNPDVNLDALVQFCGSVPTLLIIAGYELRRRGNTASACNEILMEMSGQDRDYIVEIVYLQLRGPSREAFLNIACFLDGWERSRVAQIVGEMELRDLEGAALVTTCEDGKVIMPYRVKAVARNLCIPNRNPMCIVLTEQHIPMDEGLINVADPEGLLHMNECLINRPDRALFTVDQGSNIFSVTGPYEVLKLLYVINLKESSLRIVVTCSDLAKTTLVTLTAVFSLCRNCMKDRIQHYPFEKDLVETEYYFQAFVYICEACEIHKVIDLNRENLGMRLLLLLINGKQLLLPLRSKILVTTRNLSQTDILGHPDGIQVRFHTVDLSELRLWTAYKRRPSIWHFYDFGELMIPPHWLMQICKGIPCILKFVVYELRRRGNSPSAFIQVGEEIQDLTKTEGEADPPQLMVDIAYRQLEEPSQNAFLDIAFYFYGWERSKVADIVGEMELRNLEEAGLVTISEAGRVRMCDIVKSRGRELGQGSRIRDWESLRLVLRDRQKLKKIQGIWLDDGEYVGFLKCKHIDFMSKSLRVLYLGASITGRLKRAFKELRFLHIANENLFSMPPVKRLKRSGLLSFVDVSLTRRLVNSEGEFTITLPESLQLLQLQANKSNSSGLLHINGLFSSLRDLKLGSFISISESLGNYSVLENLKLEECSQLKRLPQSFGNLSSLKLLDMSGCSMLEILPESFGNLSSLERLLLRGCSEFKKLPDTFGNLSSLKELDMSNCSMLEILPDSFGNLSSLGTLFFRGCCKLQKLPDTFGNLSSLTLLDMGNCSMLAMLPDSFGNLSCLRNLFLPGCSKLEELPDTFGSLSSLRHLDMSDCCILLRLSHNFCNLSSLRHLNLTHCLMFSRYPENFETFFDRCAVYLEVEQY